jgi:hypothetical protein
VQQALDTLNREMVEIKQTLKLDINCVLQALHTIMSVLPQQWKEGREGSDAGGPPQSDSRGLGGDAGQIVFRQIVFHNTTDDWSRRSSGHRILWLLSWQRPSGLSTRRRVSCWGASCGEPPHPLRMGRAWTF